MSELLQIKLALTTVLAPMASFVLIFLFFLRQHGIAKWVSLLGIATSALCSSLLLWSVDSPVHNVTVALPWLLPGDMNFSIGLLLDPLSLVMLWIVAIIGTLVQMYSFSYMESDEKQAKFFAFISLFCFAMMGFTIAPNLFQSYVFWELVGLGSYLLIGFWNHLPSAATAARKAFIVTRLGDLGFFAAILFAFAGLGSVDYAGMASNKNALWTATLGGLDVATWTSIGLFLAVAGKSAQFPLYGWLPDAMEGPTPVSALIHAATMVAAGVYLLARNSFLLTVGSEACVTAWEGIAAIAMLTALMSGAVAIVQNDIKRVFAYSTISQLGYMVVGIGTGAVVAGMMHLFTHAFFKALLFLSAGAFIHAAHSNSIQDIARAGGAKLRVPMFSLIAGSFALAGLFPFAGFYSKDAILEHLLVEHHYVLLTAALIGVLVTSYYTFRVIFVMITEKGHGHDHPLHTGAWMVPPLVLLMIGALFSGNIWNLAVDRWFVIEHGGHGNAALITALVSSGVALLGIFYAWRVFYRRSSADPMETMKGLANVLREKWYLDWSYDKLVHSIYLPFTWLLNRVELRFVKGALDNIGAACMRIARGFSRLQSGEVQQYFGLMLAATAVVILLITRL